MFIIIAIIGLLVVVMVVGGIIKAIVDAVKMYREKGDAKRAKAANIVNKQ